MPTIDQRHHRKGGTRYSGVLPIHTDTLAVSPPGPQPDIPHKANALSQLSQSTLRLSDDCVSSAIRTVENPPMIMMEHPSISINSHDVPGPNYKMWRTIVAPESTEATDVVRMIERHNVEAVSAKKSPLRNIIINCHGLEGGGRLSIGGEGHVGIHQGNVGMFASLRPLNVGTIWLVAWFRPGENSK